MEMRKLGLLSEEAGLANQVLLKLGSISPGHIFYLPTHAIFQKNNLCSSQT
jgi:hypothetical protein